ncbi:MAG: ATP-binding protein [Terrimicrobiaceae bacterium]|nr:ATP-binding protein [Terrimicrobiaceae bacterium]
MKPSRIGRWISRAISLLAPPLHSLHWKVFLLCLVAIFLPGIYLAWKVGQGIERSHLRSTERGMIDTAMVVAEMWTRQGMGSLPTVREIRRSVFRDFDPNLRVAVYDADGRVLEDSEKRWTAGTDHSDERDVRRALRQEYGAKWERDPYRRVVVLYAAVPILRDGQLTGVVRVIKTTEDVRSSVIRSLADLALPALLALVLAAGAAYALSTYITGILKSLAGRAEAVARGEQGIGLETWSKSELGDLARAVERMRRKLEGKAYVESMVTTLSHEIKTPLAAIRGAAEIAESSDDPAVRSKFLANILREVDRLSAIVDNLLALSRLETQPLDRGARCSLQAVAESAAEAASARAETAGVGFMRDLQAGDSTVALPEDVLRRLFDVLLDNAVQFTPAGGSVTLRVGAGRIEILDEGPGIPNEHRGRIFDRFFTTTNPVTGRRGTGLGLAIARSIADRCRARLRLENRPTGGAVATVEF